MTAHVLDLNLEGLLGTLVGALEGHVLEEVGGTVVGGGLVAGSGIDPNADGGGFSSRDGSDATRRPESRAVTSVDGARRT